MSSTQYGLSEFIVFASLAMLVAGQHVVIVFKRPRIPLAFRSADASHGVERARGEHSAESQSAIRRCSSAWELQQGICPRKRRARDPPYEVYGRQKSRRRPWLWSAPLKKPSPTRVCALREATCP